MQTRETHADRLAAVIRDEADRVGMTITELAEKTGLKRPYISLRLNGHRGFNAVDLDKIGLALGTPAWELMYRARSGDEASGVVLLEARHVDLDGGDAA